MAYSSVLPARLTLGAFPRAQAPRPVAVKAAPSTPGPDSAASDDYEPSQEDLDNEELFEDEDGEYEYEEAEAAPSGKQPGLGASLAASARTQRPAPAARGLQGLGSDQEYPDDEEFFDDNGEGNEDEELGDDESGLYEAFARGQQSSQISPEQAAAAMREIEGEISVWHLRWA